MLIRNLRRFVGRLGGRAAARSLDETLSDLEAERGMSRTSRQRLRTRLHGIAALARVVVATVLAAWPSGSPLAEIGMDVRHAWRRLRRQPGFTLVAIVMLGLGVGSVATLFSVVNGAALRGADVPEAGRIVGLARVDDRGRGGGLSYPDVSDVDAASDAVFESVAAFRNWQGTLSAEGRADTVHGEVVSGDYFRVLKLTPAAGRLPAPVDDGGAAEGIVISEAFWRSRFGRRADVIGRSVSVAGEPFTIIGVAPEGFRGLTTPSILRADVWLPLRALPRGSIGPRTLTARNVVDLRAIARLRPDVEVQAAEALLASVSAHLQPEWAESGSRQLRLLSFDDVVTPREVATAALSLGAVTVGLAVLVLLIACGNLAQISFAHALERSGELAIRVANGASRWRLFRLLMTETTLIVGVAGAVGLGLAWGIAHLLASTTLPVLDGMQVAPDIRPDARVFAVTLAVAALAAVATGFLPALRASRLSPAQVIAGSGAAGGSTRRSRGRMAVVAGQVAISMALLLAAATLVRSLNASVTFDRGFDTAHQAILRVDLDAHGYDDSTGPRFLARLQQAAAELPGVSGAALFDRFPTTTYSVQTVFVPETDALAGAAKEVAVRTFAVSPGFFEVVGLPVRAGRTFAQSDTAASPRVIVVSAALAQRVWPGQDPVGRRLTTERAGRLGKGPLSFEVIGVTGDIGVYARQSPAFAAWVPASQSHVPSMGVVVRTTEAPALAAERLKGALAVIDDRVAPLEAMPLAVYVEDVVALTRLAANVLTVLAGVALAIALVGLYAIVAHYVGTRTREIGVRMAIGATARDVHWMIQRQTLRFMVTGLAVGIVVGWLVDPIVARMLFGVTVAGPLTTALLAAIVLATGLMATAVPARRAARIDPLRTLRSQ